MDPQTSLMHRQGLEPQAAAVLTQEAGLLGPTFIIRE